MIATEATQAIICSMRRNCSVFFYFSIKESDDILSELKWSASDGAVCPQWVGVLRKGTNFG